MIQQYKLYQLFIYLHGRENLFGDLQKLNNLISIQLLAKNDNLLHFTYFAHLQSVCSP